MIHIVSFYHFMAIPAPQALRDRLAASLRHNNLTGSVFVAGEGINGTISGTRLGVQAWLENAQQLLGGVTFAQRHSRSRLSAFAKGRVKVRDEIVAFGEPVDVSKRGEYVDPQIFNRLVEDPGTRVIDCRNQYEVAMGQFAGAENPETQTFKEFIEFVDNTLSADKTQPIAMYCTGGIRCEKATAYMVGKGFEKVYHLKGGILRYLEQVPPENSHWQGDCFVFDDRIAVDHARRPKPRLLCPACRTPLVATDLQHPHHRENQCCRYCYHDQKEALHA